MTPATNNHQHSYKRVRGKDNTYRCLDPHCSHFVTSEFLEGKAAACASCGEEFVISSKQLQLKRVLLKCANCKTRAEFGGKVIKPVEVKKAAGEALNATELEQELRKLIS